MSNGGEGVNSTEAHYINQRITELKVDVDKRFDKLSEAITKKFDKLSDQVQTAILQGVVNKTKLAGIALLASIGGGVIVTIGKFIAP